MHPAPWLSKAVLHNVLLLQSCWEDGKYKIYAGLVGVLSLLTAGVQKQFVKATDDKNVQ